MYEEQFVSFCKGVLFNKKLIIIVTIIKQIIYMRRFVKYTSNKHTISVALDPREVLNWFKMGYKWKENH